MSGKRLLELNLYTMIYQDLSSFIKLSKWHILQKFPIADSVISDLLWNI